MVYLRLANDHEHRAFQQAVNTVESRYTADRPRAPALAPARSGLLAVCGVTFLVLLWAMFASPAINGFAGWDVNSDLVITYVKPEFPAAKAGLRAGDRVGPLNGGFSDNVANRRFIAGVPSPINVKRGSHNLVVTVLPIAMPSDAYDWTSNAGNLWLLIFAGILAWVGTERRARMIAWLLALTVLGQLLLPAFEGSFISRSPWLNELAFIASWPISALPIALLATVSSTFAPPPNQARRVLTLCTYIVAAVTAIFGVVLELSLVVPSLYSVGFASAKYFPYWIAGAYTLAGVCALVSFLATRGNDRQRAAWVLLPLIAMFFIAALTYATTASVAFWSGIQLPLLVASNIASFITPILLTYALLRHQLLDIDFVVNRAAVFAGVSFVVIIVFVILEWLFDKFFSDASHTTNTLVSAGIALVLGLSLRFIHRNVDHIVDRVFFRVRHQREQALRTFANEAAYITDSNVLLDDTINEVAKNTEADCVSVLVPDADGCFVTARTTNGLTQRLSENDRAILKMRALHAAIALDRIDTTLVGARAYPLMSKGELHGVLVCGSKRRGQTYAPDEDEALAAVAYAVGSALGTLRPDDDLKMVMREIRDALRVLVKRELDAPR